MPSNTDPFQTALISPSEYHAAIQNASSRIIPVAAGRAVLHNESLQRQHLPGSVFFDMDVIRDVTSSYPQMLPSAPHFARCVGDLGIKPDDVVVVYDTYDVGTYSAPRVAYTFRVFGHINVHVLNNFRLYTAQGYPVQQGEMLPRPKSEYPVSSIDCNRVIAFDELKEIIKHQKRDIQILDSRIPGRWTGAEDEAKPELRSGHMPESINIPLASMLDKTSDAIICTKKLRQLFEDKGVSPSKPTITTCNSGVTAAVLDMVLGEIGYEVPSKRIYDGSWTEWTQRVDEEQLIAKSI